MCLGFSTLIYFLRVGSYVFMYPLPTFQESRYGFLGMRYDSLGVELVSIAHCNSFGSMYLPLWLFLLFFIWILFNVELF